MCGPAALSAVLSVALFDFFFVQPHLSFAVSDVQYLITFAVMLIVGFYYLKNAFPVFATFAKNDSKFLMIMGAVMAAGLALLVAGGAAAYFVVLYALGVRPRDLVHRPGSGAPHG